MSSTHILGRGSFGQVRREGNVAVKKFEKLSHLIQEVTVTTYFRDSPYIIKCEGYDLEKLEMRTQLHEISLRDALLKYELKREQKHAIFRDILCGLVHIHSRNIVHADLKPSNVLVDFNPARATICDLGLSSTDRYSKVRQTARAYRLPDTMINEDNGAYHDLYSLSIVGIELFADIKLEDQVSYHHLLKILKEVSTSINDEKLMRAIRGMIKRSQGYTSARSVLIELYNIDTCLPIPALPNIPNTLSKDEDKYLETQVQTLTTSMQIRRGRRCYYVLCERFCNRSYEPVRREEYQLYMVSMCIINSALFGQPGFTYKHAISASHNRWGKRDINRAIYDIIGKYDLINFMMLR